MSLAELVPLLRSLRDRVADPDALARARALVANEAALPAELRDGVFDDDAAAAAAGLLAVLGCDETLGGALTDAIAREGGVELAPSVLAAVGLHDEALPIADAVRDAAGEVDLVAAVSAFTEGAWISAFLDHELDPSAHRLAAHTLMRAGGSAEMTALADLGQVLREAAHDEAGEVDLWSGIAGGIGLAEPEEVPGWDGALLAEAVQHEAGEIDVADTVMERILRHALALGPSAAPPPANTSMGWWLPALAGMAAALLVGVLYGRLPGAPSAVEGTSWDVQFASSEEIAIDDLSYGVETMVQVFQGDGDNAPLIIWIDDQEARL